LKSRQSTNSFYRQLLLFLYPAERHFHFISKLFVPSATASYSRLRYAGIFMSFIHARRAAQCLSREGRSGHQPLGEIQDSSLPSGWYQNRLSSRVFDCF
jgi:hypothetical protein